MAVMGFKVDAMIARPVKKFLSGSIIAPPDYVIAVADSEFATKAGRRFVEAGGELREMAVVGLNEVAQMMIRA